MSPPEAAGTAAPPALELREIEGPSAFGGGLRRAWDLIWLLALTEFRLQYTNTTLGYVWSVLKPFAFFGVIYLVISQVLQRFAEGITDYPERLILALVIFQYFSEVTGAALRSISTRESMLRKAQFPRIVIPLSLSLNAAISLAFNLAGVFLLLIVAGVDPQAHWLLVPVAVLALVVLTTTLSMLLSVAFVRSEDVGQGWTLTLRALFYATPILYSLTLLPEWVRPLINANPLAPIIEYMRVWVINPSAETPYDLLGPVQGLLIPFAIAVVIGIAGFFWFRRDAPTIAEAL
jgi:ABC-2 type transport system permease protein